MTTRKSKEERRKEITEASIKVIGEHGLREFTAARIAKEVGIKDGTIFRHFKDMDEITLSVVDRIQELLEAMPLSMDDPLERLESFVMGRLHSVSVQPGIQSLIFSDQMSHALGAEGPRRIAALRNRGRAFIKSCLLEAVENGSVRDDLDIEVTVVLITGMVMGFLFAAKDGFLPAPAGEMEQRCWKILRSALERKQVNS